MIGITPYHLFKINLERRDPMLNSKNEVPCKDKNVYKKVAYADYNFTYKSMKEIIGYLDKNGIIYTMYATVRPKDKSNNVCELELEGDAVELHIYRDDVNEDLWNKMLDFLNLPCRPSEADVLVIWCED
jgi:hypothetical protein